jgi:hypothetical protein
MFLPLIDGKVADNTVDMTFTDRSRPVFHSPKAA